MIIRDEEGRAIGFEKLSDLTQEVSELEKILNKALKNKKKNIPMPQDEKDEIKFRLENIKALMSSANEELKSGANAMQIISFIKEMAKLKKITENLAECVKDD